MSVALYRKYRSKSLDDVVGQDHITSILKRAIKQGKIAHAYLLTGPRGVGKTSIARILAHEINNLPYTEETNHLDIIEIDAASNNGVDDVRELRDKVNIAPSAATYKVYIIDEVHILSKAAFNALLKTLEEPPRHVVFILATTDADKLPATIISRTQRYSFRAISVADATHHLGDIAKKENIAIETDALELIAERGDGSFRDSISLLDQLSNLTEDTITRSLVEESLGLAPKQTVDTIVQAVKQHDRTTIIQTLKDAEDQGLQAPTLASQLITALRADLENNIDLLDVLEKLTDVSGSSRPDISLLVTLLAATKKSDTKTKYAALDAPSPSISAPLAQLTKQATEEKPKLVSKKQDTKPTKKKEAPIVKQETSAHVETQAFSGEFDWAALVAHTKEHYVAIYSVLNKCKYELNGTTLTIYTGNAFYKKKLDDPKYVPQLHQSLVAIGAEGLEISTTTSPAPLKNSQAAAVAAIMGGGEEVEV